MGTQAACARPARQYVAYQPREPFLTCGGCGRLYWPATHRAHMLRELAALGLGESRS